MPYSPPTYKAGGFNCPLCNFFSHQEWFEAYYGYQSTGYGDVHLDKLELSKCVKCNGYVLWYDGKIIFPIVNAVPQAHPEMPGEVKKLYDEAKGIVSNSSRASAALLRTAVAVLVDVVLGENKNTLNHNIGKLVQEKKLSIEIQQSLDYLRVIGTHELHPGVIEMDDVEQDDYQHAVSLFELLNLIVEELISRPRKVKRYYDSLPKRQKDQIEKRDSKTVSL